MRSTFVSCLLVAAAGCITSAEDGTATSSRALHSTSVMPELSIVSVQCEGELCAESSAIVAFEGNTFRLSFADAIVESVGEPITRAMRIRVGISVPAGYQFSGGHFVSKGFVQTPSLDTITTTRFTFEDSSEPPVMLERASADDDDFYFSQYLTGLWSPSCNDTGEPTSVTLSIDVTLTARPGHELVLLDQFVGILDHLEGTEWRHCDDGTLVVLPPSSAGEECAGPSRVRCEDGVVCEFELEPPVAADGLLERGHCVDPAEVLPPRGMSELCGGYRSIPCDEGLTCRFTSERSASEKRLGLCVRAVGEEGETCAGYPFVPCAAGLSCFHGYARWMCVHATGALGSRCGAGLTPCGEGLICNGTFCAVKKASP